MKKIFFDKPDSPKNKILAIPMIVFLLIYICSAFNNRDSNLHSIAAIIGFRFAVVFMGRQCFYRYYLGWNKKGMTIKLENIAVTDLEKIQNIFNTHTIVNNV